MPGSSPEVPAPTDDTVDPQVSDVSATVDSSTAEPEGAKSLLESVQAALAEGEKEASPDSGPDPDATGSPKAATSTSDPEEPLGELTPEELKAYAPKTQRRMQQLLSQRHESDARATAAEEKASRFDQFVGYVEANRLSNDDVAAIFEIGALVKNDPEKAYEKVLPVYLHLAQLTGKILPPEIQEKVDLGYLPAADAQEQVRLKTRTALLEQRTALRDSDEAARLEREAAAARESEVTSAANDWEAHRQKTDPDWLSKKELVLRVMQANVAQDGYPQNKAQTIAVLNTALEQVDKQIARFRPAPKQITPITGSSSARASAEPTTAMEAARMALGAR